MQFDTIRGQYDYDVRVRGDFVMRLRSEGYLDHILLSHDICEKDQMMCFGDVVSGSSFSTFAPFFANVAL